MENDKRHRIPAILVISAVATIGFVTVIKKKYLREGGTGYERTHKTCAE